MSSTEVWIAIIGLMIVTFVTRGFFLLMGERVELPANFQQALRYAPAAALVAIIIPEVFLVKGAIGLEGFQLNNPHMWGGLVSAGAFLMSKSIVLTIIAGMLTFTLLRIF
jgi:branched-subunit amino acid transport protein